MQKYPLIQLLIIFLKEQFVTILMVYLVPLIICIIFYLDGQNIELVLYILILITFIESILLGFQFRRYHQRYLTLLSQYSNIGITPLEYKSLTTNEAALSECIIKLQSLYFSLLKYNEVQNHEMLDYYTLWVHQIKTPIAALNLLLQTDNDNPQKEYAMAELFKIEQYAQMALQYLRLDSSSNDYVFIKLNLDKVIKPVIRKYSRLFILQKISLIYDDVNIEVISDEKWLSFVLEQIISNALKYTKQGSIKIYSLPNDILVIEDSGIGIRPEDLPRVFEKGYTGYNGRDDQRASGLGLYLCDKIIKKLNHKIKIISTIDQGTKVLLDFSQNSLNTKD